MARHYTCCHIVKIYTLNTVKFIIDFPYFLYLLISSLFGSLWGNCTAKKKSLDNEIILITGAASGLGQHVALKMAKLSCKAILVLWDINHTALLETAEKCRSLGSTQVHTFVVDLSSHGDITRAARLVRSQVEGSVTMLFNNAGIGPYKLFLDSDPDTEEKVLRVNLLSQMYTLREFLPEMLSSGKGHVISTCSGLGFLRFRYLSAYAASKHGLRGFLETLKLEISLHPQKPKINFTVIYPGWVKTTMTSLINWEPRYEVDLLMHMDPERVSEKILDGILREKEEIFVPDMLRHLLFWQGYLPTSLRNRMENYLFRNISLIESEVLTV